MILDLGKRVFVNPHSFKDLRVPNFLALQSGEQLKIGRAHV